MHTVKETHGGGISLLISSGNVIAHQARYLLVWILRKINHFSPQNFAFSLIWTTFASENDSLSRSMIFLRAFSSVG
jgi:hypothetical protein